MTTTLIITGASILIELGQTQVSGRTVSTFDVLLNTEGGLVAAVIAVRVLRIRSEPWPLIAAAGGGVFVAVIGFLATTGHEANRRLRLAGWDPIEYSVVSGSEVGGGNAYLGTVRNALICAGPSHEEVCLAPGAAVRARQSLTEAATGSQLLRVGADVTSESDTQAGPSRIITFSGDFLERNMTLGQAQRSLVLRLRTPHAGPNGTNLVFLLPEAVSAGTPTRIAAQYRPGGISVTAETETASTAANYRWGYLSGWGILNPQYRGAEGGQRFGTTVKPRVLVFMALIGAAALSLPIGILAGAFTAAHSLGRVGLAMAGPPVLLLGISWPLGGPTTVYELGLCTAFGIAGLLLGRSLGPGGLGATAALERLRA